MQHIPHLLSFILGEDQDRALLGGSPSLAGKLRYDMLIGIVDDRMHGIEPQAVEMELTDPIGRVRRDEFANGATMFAVEIECVAPFRMVLVGYEVRRERARVVAAW